jgi:hypothetical protein
VVLLVSQDALAVGNLGIAGFGLFNRQVEMPGQSFDICPGNINPIVAATIGRAFIAIIQDAQGAPVSIRARHSLPSTGWSTWNGSLVIVAADCDLDKYIAAPACIASIFRRFH